MFSKDRVHIEIDHVLRLNRVFTDKLAQVQDEVGTARGDDFSKQFRLVGYISQD